MTDTETELREAAEKIVYSSLSIREGEVRWQIEARAESSVKQVVNTIRPLLEKRDAEIAALKTRIECSERNAKEDYRQMVVEYGERTQGLRDELAAARKEVAELKEALEFYAEPSNYDERGCPGNVVGTAKGDMWERDRGYIAREAVYAARAAAKEKD